MSRKRGAGAGQTGSGAAVLGPRRQIGLDLLLVQAAGVALGIHGQAAGPPLDPALVAQRLLAKWTGTPLWGAQRAAVLALPHVVAIHLLGA